MSIMKVVVGAQWGDEGKGKIVDMLAGDFDVVCRCQGGDNADHNVVVDGVHYTFRIVPSGILRKGIMCVIGNGVVLHIADFFKEIDELMKIGVEEIEPRMRISERAHIVFDVHRQVDQLEEEGRVENILGTTMLGIGPAYASKMGRKGLRVGDFVGDWKIFCEKYKQLIQSYKRAYPDLHVDVAKSLADLATYRERMIPMVRDTVYMLNKFSADNTHEILIECAQSTMLDIDMGFYPYVTSSNCSVAGVCTGLGLAPSRIGDVYGVTKAYFTRISAGPFPTEIFGDVAEHLRSRGKEYSNITKKMRRVGWFDVVVSRYTHMVNNFTALALTKLDVLDDFDEIKIGKDYFDPEIGVILQSLPSDIKVLERVHVKYETLPGWKQSTTEIREYSALPAEARRFIETIEKLCGFPVMWIGVGEDREQIITKNG